MSSYAAEYQNAVDTLAQYGVEEAKTDAWYLLEYVTGLNRASYLVKREEEMPTEERSRYADVLQQRAQRIPLQYITGVQEFMGFPFAVSRATLIPRQDTEVLVECVMKYADGKRVLDLCTGTGCIILSLAKLCKLAGAVGTDIAEEAVETARKNALALDAQADFFVGDLYQALEQEERFDIIVSNPPYIPSAVIETLAPEVKVHEPMTALDGAADGLKFYRAIVAEAKRYLAEDGRIFFEIGCEQAEDVETILCEHGFTEIQVVKDYAGLDRVVSAKRSQE